VYELAATGTPMVAIGLAANQTPTSTRCGGGGARLRRDVHDAALGRARATLAALAADPGARRHEPKRSGLWTVGGAAGVAGICGLIGGAE